MDVAYHVIPLIYWNYFSLLNSIKILLEEALFVILLYSKLLWCIHLYKIDIWCGIINSIAVIIFSLFK